MQATSKKAIGMADKKECQFAYDFFLQQTHEESTLRSAVVPIAENGSYETLRVQPQSFLGDSYAGSRGGTC